MGTIAHISDNGPVLGCAGSMLMAISEEALKRASDEHFVLALKEVELYRHISLHRFPNDCKKLFADSTEQVAARLENSTEFDGIADYIARLHWIAEEVRKTIT